MTDTAADHWWWLAIPFLLASAAIIAWPIVVLQFGQVALTGVVEVVR